MVKRGLKLFGIGFGTLVILAGVVVGILFATGVIEPKQDKQPPDTTDPTDPSGQSTDLAGPGTVRISNVTGDTRVINYDVGSTCKDYTGCSIVVKLKFYYDHGSEDVVTQTHPGSGGRYSYSFRNGWFGQTRIPIGVELSGHSVRNGVKGKESTTVTIRIPS